MSAKIKDQTVEIIELLSRPEKEFLNERISEQIKFHKDQISHLSKLIIQRPECGLTEKDIVERESLLIAWKNIKLFISGETPYFDIELLVTKCIISLIMQGEAMMAQNVEIIKDLKSPNPKYRCMSLKANTSTKVDLNSEPSTKEFNEWADMEKEMFRLNAAYRSVSCRMLVIMQNTYGVSASYKPATFEETD